MTTGYDCYSFQRLEKILVEDFSFTNGNQHSEELKRYHYVILRNYLGGGTKR